MEIVLLPFHSEWLLHDFPPLLFLARVYSTVLKRNCTSSHLCVFPGIRGRVFGLSPLSVMWVVVFLFIYPISNWGCPFLFLIECFYHKEIPIFFGQMLFFYIYWDECVYCQLLIWWLIGFSNVKPILYSLDKHHLLMVLIFFYTLLD